MLKELPKLLNLKSILTCHTRKEIIEAEQNRPVRDEGLFPSKQNIYERGKILSFN